MAESIQEKSRLKKIYASSAFRWGVGIIAALVLILYCAGYLLDEPLRRIMERNMNRDLKGYSVRLPGLHLQLIGLSLTLKGLTVLQDAHPEPPVVAIPVLKASVHWREIFSGRLVAEFMLDQPKVNINLKQLRSEAASSVSLKERGWQQALEDIYPLKINLLKISDATVTYIDTDPKKPLVLSNLNLRADNIRNIHLPDQVYPSPFHLDTAIFGNGHGSIDGDANFLGQPYPGVKGRIHLDKVPMDYFSTVFARSNLSIHGGVLQADGDAEYSPQVKTAHLKDLTVSGLKIDYIHSKATAVKEKKRAVVAGKAVKKLSNKPGLLLRADRLNLLGCNLGMVNKASRKPYRLFIADADFHLSNFSNQFSQGPAHAKLTGKFMDSGKTTASATFRPEHGGPDLDLYIKIEETSLTAMNDLLRAYGDFDVSAGVFSLVTELHIKDETISGYIKPFFKGMNVYDRRTDKERGLIHQMYEMSVGGVARLLVNRPRHEVATMVVVKGPVGNPETSTWQIVGALIKNAFFKAILPGFEKKASGAVKR